MSQLGKERGRNDHGEGNAGDCKPRSPRFKHEGPLDPDPKAQTLLDRLQSGKQFLLAFQPKLRWTLVQGEEFAAAIWLFARLSQNRRHSAHTCRCALVLSASPVGRSPPT